MILILGFLSLLQVLFLPGLIINKLIGNNRLTPVTISATIVLSLLVNYFLMILLLLLNLYSFISLLCVAAIELSVDHENEIQG